MTLLAPPLTPLKKHGSKIEELKTVLRNLEVIKRDDHFVLTSGQHTDTYINKNALYKRPDITSDVCKTLAEIIVQTLYPTKIDAVIAPAIGGIPISQWLAYHIHKAQQHITFAAYSTGHNGIITINKEYQQIISKNKVVILDDTITTGGSLKQLMKAVQQIDGQILTCASIFNRGGITAEEIGVPSLISLFDIPLQTYERKTCTLCKQGVPINKTLGHP